MPSWPGAAARMVAVTAVLLCFGAMETALDTLGAGKIVFGVDFPLIESIRLTAALDQLGLSAKDYDRIAWKNSAELFKLDEKAIGAIA